MATPQSTSLIEQVWFTTREAANYCRCHVETLKRAVGAGALQSSQAGPGGWHRFHRDWLDAWLVNGHRLPRPRTADGRTSKRAT